jgi:hypothetical protein
MAAAPQSLSDIEERIELLRTTLGLFAPEEPLPIADELVQMAGDVLRHRLAGRGLSPTAGGADAAALLALGRQAGAAEIGEELIRLRGFVAADPKHEETVQHLQAMVKR